MGGNAHWWDAVAPLLSPSLRPVGLDFLGHGDSPWSPDGDYHSGVFVSNLEDARRRLGPGPFLLAGHSLGARICLDYAARQPEGVAGLILGHFLSEVYRAKKRRFKRLKTRAQPGYPDQDAMLKRFHLEPDDTLLSPEALRTLGRDCIRREGEGWTWKFDWRAFLYRYEPVWPLLDRIKTPTMVIRGEHSLVMRRDDFERVVAGLPAGRGLEIPKAHHHVPLDTPTELAAAILSFAESLTPFPQE